MLFWWWCSNGFTQALLANLVQIGKHFVAWKIKTATCTIFLQIYKCWWQKGCKSKLTTVFNSGEGRLGEPNFMTVRDCGSTSPSCSDISHHCQFSHFRVRSDIHHQLTWETLVEWRSIGIFMDKGSKYPAANGWKHQRWVRSLVTLLIYDWWLLALTLNNILSRTLCLSADREIYVEVWIYI